VQQRAAISSTKNMLNAGLAVHSLRAVSEASIRALSDDASGPIHIHVAEQTAEVDDCLRTMGTRPVQWLCDRLGVDSRWHLVHATHVTAQEIDAVAQRGAGLVLCPSTEANLGDGITDVGHWLRAGVPLTIGSDSHVTRCWREELRLLEYGQRLVRRQRNVLRIDQQSTGQTLVAAISSGAAAAAGMSHWGLVKHARADLLLLNPQASNLRGIPQQRWLDACIFSAPGASFADVMVAGVWRIQRASHAPSSATTSPNPV
jgi:formimidoylglutamate deiminase